MAVLCRSLSQPTILTPLSYHSLVHDDLRGAGTGTLPPMTSRPKSAEPWCLVGRARWLERLLADPATAPHDARVLVIDERGDRKDPLHAVPYKRGQALCDWEEQSGVADQAGDRRGSRDHGTGGPGFVFRAAAADSAYGTRTGSEVSSPRPGCRS